MSGESTTAPSGHSEDSFDIVPNDAGRTVDKLLEVLSNTTEVLAQNQVVLINLGQTMDAAFKETRQKERKLLALRNNEVNVLDSQQEALSEEFNVKRDAMRDVLRDLMNDATLRTSGAAAHFDISALIYVLRVGFEQTRMALLSLADAIGNMLRGMNINDKQLEANDDSDRRMAELAEELSRKCTAIASLEEAVQRAYEEIHLLKGSEQESDRQMTAMTKKIQELDQLQSMDYLDIGHLRKTVEDARYEIQILKDREQEKDGQVTAMSKKIEELEKLQATAAREIGDLWKAAEDEQDKAKELKELQAMDSRDIGDLWKTVEDKQAKVKARASLDGEEKKTTKKSKKGAGTKHSDKAAPATCGRTVSLMASNGYFICGNHGNAPATVTGIIADGDSVRFKVMSAGNGKVALKSCGKYLSITEDGRRVLCDSRTLDEWSMFNWIKHDYGVEWIEPDAEKVSLRGANGNYVSSAYGRSFVTCICDEAGPQERFTVV